MAIFVNFMALPSLGVLLGFDVPTTNVVISEEETHSSNFTLFEKTLPGTISVHDFIKFFAERSLNQLSNIYSEDFHLSPLLTIFSPPPEDLIFS